MISEVKGNAMTNTQNIIANASIMIYAISIPSSVSGLSISKNILPIRQDQKQPTLLVLAINPTEEI